MAAKISKISGIEAILQSTETPRYEDLSGNDLEKEKLEKLIIELPTQLKHRLKVYAVNQGKSMRDVVSGVLEKLLDETGY